jgi:CHAT domain-containing protein/Tfp pilus assembly protein PilF
MFKPIIVSQKPDCRLRLLLCFSSIILISLCVQAALATNARDTENLTELVQTVTPRAAQQGTTAQKGSAPTLSPGQIIEREISGGQSHSFQVTFDAGQYAKLRVDQRGIDVVLRVAAPNSETVGEFDDENRLFGQEIAELIPGTAGNYTLTVAAKYRHFPAGHYEIQIVELREATERDRHSRQQRRQLAEATKLYRSGKYDEGVRLAEDLQKELERDGRSDSELMGETFNAIGGIAHARGDYAKAETCFQNARSVLEKALGPDHPDLLRILYNLGVLYKDRGDFAKSIQFHQQALAGREKALGPDSADVVQSLTNFATVYRVTGDYAKAEEMQLRALAIQEKIQGPDDPDVGWILFNMGALYYVKRDYARAAEVSERALRIREKELGPDHPDIGRILNNLSVIYIEQGDYIRAETVILRALAIRQKIFGPNSLRLTDQLQTLAEVYAAREELTRAEPLLLRAREITEASLPPDHPDVARSLENLAELYYLQQAYSKAEPLFRRALAIREKSLGPDHPDVVEPLNGLARLYEARGDIAEAISYQERANSVVERENELKLFAGSQSEQFAYFNFLTEQTNQTVSLNVQRAPDNQEACDLAVTTILQRKGRVQDEVAGSMAALQRRLGRDDQALLEGLNATTSRLAGLVLGGVVKVSTDEHQKQVKAMEEQREALEIEISHRSAGFYEPSQRVTLKSVQAAIPDDAALIEFALYRPLIRRVADKRKAYGELHYVAYVIRRKGNVQWRELGPADQIDRVVSAWRDALRDPARRDVRQLARSVDAKIMQPLTDVLDVTDHLLISPDGQLNLIPFAALVDERGQFRILSHTVSYLTSGRDLLRLQVTRQSKSPPVVVADPSFGEPSLIAEAPKSNTGSGQRLQVDYSKVFFGPLPGVADEVRVLKGLMPDARFLTREQATKSELEKLRAPSILHIATHGFFLPVETDEASHAGNPGGAAATASQVATRSISVTARTENPLLRSGLALAGANQNINGTDDGILTALEASGLDLWGTRLVVLSACDTGLGEVKNGEGVYGLRRAFVLAGAESQMMSLWAVSDRSTRDLIIDFYKTLLKGIGRSEALRQAQLKMLRSKPHPYYWAGFIHAGEWANLEGKR